MYIVHTSNVFKMTINIYLLFYVKFSIVGTFQPNTKQINPIVYLVRHIICVNTSFISFVQSYHIKAYRVIVSFKHYIMLRERVTTFMKTLKAKSVLKWL